MKEVLTCFVLCFGTWVGCDDLFRMDFVPFVFSALLSRECTSCADPVNSFVCALSYGFILFLFKDYLLLRLLLVDCRSFLADY